MNRKITFWAIPDVSGQIPAPFSDAKLDSHSFEPSVVPYSSSAPELQSKESKTITPDRYTLFYPRAQQLIYISFDV